MSSSRARTPTDLIGGEAGTSYVVLARANVKACKDAGRFQPPVITVADQRAAARWGRPLTVSNQLSANDQAQHLGQLSDDLTDLLISHGAAHCSVR